MSAPPDDALPSATPVAVRDIPLSTRLWVLFSRFALIAATVLGGGYAILPVVEDEFVRRRRWVSEEEILDMLVIVQTLPGVMAGNSAVYIGYRCAGLPGALVSVVGIALPSVAIIIAIASCMERINLGAPALQGAFIGAQAALVGLVLHTGIRMFRKIRTLPMGVPLAVLSVVAIVVVGVAPMKMLLAGLVFGVVCGGFRALRARAGGKEQAS